MRRPRPIRWSSGFSGIDMALALIERLWDRQMAEAVQLVIEYDPQPTVDTGSPAKASPQTQQQAPTC